MGFGLNGSKDHISDSFEECFFVVNILLQCDTVAAKVACETFTKVSCRYLGSPWMMAPGAAQHERVVSRQSVLTKEETESVTKLAVSAEIGTKETALVHVSREVTIV